MTHSHDTSTPAMSAETVPSEEKCIACGVPFRAGDAYYPDASGGEIHAECAGTDREGYTNADGDPLGSDDPIPTPLTWEDDAAPDLSASHLAKESGEAGVDGSQAPLSDGGLRHLDRIAEIVRGADSRMEAERIALDFLRGAMSNEERVERAARDWAVAKWHEEVANRPLQNTHRRSLDTTWRQVIRYFGGDDERICGPRHDDLVATHDGMDFATQETQVKPLEWQRFDNGRTVTYRAMCPLGGIYYITSANEDPSFEGWKSHLGEFASLEAAKAAQQAEHEEKVHACLALASLPQPSPALAKGGDAVRLLPCPFCGGEPTLHPHSPDHMLGAWVSCSTCGLESPTETGRSVEAAVQHWNTRAALSTPTEGPDEAAESGQAGVIKAAYFEGFADAQRALGSVDDMWDVSVAALKADDAEDVEAKYLAAPSIDLMQRIWANLYYNEADAGYSYQGTLNDVVDWLAERNALPPTEGPASQTEGMGGDAVRERIARALNGALGSEEDEHPRHHPAQNSWEKPSEVWWTQWLEAADAVIAALTPPETAEAVPVAASGELPDIALRGMIKDINSDHDAEVARLREDLERVMRERDALDEKVTSLSAHETCACSYDIPGDVCLHHSPRLVAAERERDDAVKALETARAKADRGEHLARTVSQVHFRLEDGDRYSVSMFDANNMVGLARSASSQGGE